MTFGDNLKLLRRSMGFKSAKEFANSLNINEFTYRNYETRNSLPSEENIIKIATKLQVTTDAVSYTHLRTIRLSSVSIRRRANNVAAANVAGKLRDMMPAAGSGAGGPVT